MTPTGERGRCHVGSSSADWVIMGVKLHMDILHVDEALMQPYASHLLKDSSFVAPFRSYSAISFQHGGSNTAILQIPHTFLRCNQI